MELRHLRYFIAVAEELSFTRAAERLDIAQPPLSHQIRQLEEELGVRLLDRTSRSVELTYAGKVFLGEARGCVEQVNRAVHAVRRADGKDCGTLTIGAGLIPVHSVLPAILPAFRREFPRVDFKLRELLPEEQSHELRHGIIDVGFVTPPLDEAGLLTAPIWNDGVVAVLPAGHAMAARQRVTLQELAAERWILPQRRIAPTYYDLLIASCAASRFSPVVVHETDNFPSAFALVVAGIGAALAPASMYNAHMPGAAVVAIDGLHIPVVVAWRGGENSPVVLRFLDLVREQAKHMQPSAREAGGAGL